MKKISVIILMVNVIAISGCSDVKREPGSIYMPDMAYSRAYETYSERDSTIFTSEENHSDDKIFYNSLPVTGTIARGEELPFPLTKDAAGDTANYAASKLIANPLPPLTAEELKESERLYLINCGICHGAKLNGNGPLYKDGNGPYAAKPAALVGDAKYENMPDGQMYYSILYGKNLMGSYASQLNRDQRWKIIHYIKAKQAEAKGGSAPVAVDSATVVKK
jgi:mono/diheme cytochrome c family protein